MNNKTMDNIKTVNSAARTVLFVGVVGIFGYLAYLGFDHWIRPGLDAQKIREEMAALQVKFDVQREELVRTQTALKLVKVDERKAVIKVLEKGVDPETKQPFSVVQFTEVDKQGNQLDKPREFRLQGDMMHLDCWIVKFEDQYVEQADELRGKSLFVFKSIAGELDPRGIHKLDQTDSPINTAYGSLDQQSDFERQIWEDFWEIANDRSKQDTLGIRANHGQENYIHVQSGKIYEVELRASGGVTILTADQ